ncbi:hypothetical protein LTR15_008051 [Elasticomyces elasticus]|nr:hypothetical protein LTR15_008051 [Elasticomyces elasticus]
MSWFSTLFEWFNGDTLGQSSERLSTGNGPPSTAHDGQHGLQPSMTESQPGSRTSDRQQPETRPLPPENLVTRHREVFEDSSRLRERQPSVHRPTDTSSVSNGRRPSQLSHRPIGREPDRMRVTASQTHNRAGIDRAEHGGAVSEEQSDGSDDDDVVDDNGFNEPLRQHHRPDRPSDTSVPRADIYEVHKQSRDPFRHFVVGRVIEKLLSPPPTSTALSTADYASTGVRRFVVIRAPTQDDPTFEAL